MSTKKNLIAFTGIAMILILAAFQTKDDSFEQFIKKIETYIRANPQEKVYLQLDKPYYAVGDNIWFKSYIIDAEHDHLSDLSRIIYVDLINDRDSIVQSLTLPVTRGLSWGNFTLTDSLSEGNYRVRAFTQLMLNGSPDYFFDKTIKVGNSWSNQISVKAAYTFAKNADAESMVNSVLQFSDKDSTALAGRDLRYEVIWNDKVVKSGSGKTNSSGIFGLDFNSPKDAGAGRGRILATVTMPDKKKIVKDILIEAVSNKVDVQFFPEGGNMIESIPGRLGVKAVNAAGKGKNISGSIVDNEGNFLISFETKFLGMGNFTITPEAGKSYKAKVKFADGSEQEFPLPPVQKSGYAISVNNADSSRIQVKIAMSTDLMAVNAEVNLLVQHNGYVYFASKSNGQKQVISASIPKKDLPSGINHIVVVTGNNRPVCERLVFINNAENRLPLKLESDQQVYKRRGQVIMSFSDLNASVGGGSFSVAITNADIVVPDLDGETNILSSLLLTSDIKGFVERPNHYFLANTLETNTELENLLLTQGWSRFSWSKMIESNFPKAKFAAQKSFRISGTVNTLGGKPLPGGRVSLIASTKDFFMIDTVADANGRFVFDQLDFPDSTKFIIQGKNLKDKNKVELKLDPIPGQLITKNKNTGDLELNVNEALSHYIKQSSPYFDQQFKQGFLTRSTLQLNEVKIRAQRKNPTPYSANLNGPGKAEYLVLAKDLEKCLTIVQCLQRVPGILINSRGQPALMRSRETSMAIYLDGMRMDPDIISTLNVYDIESIEVLKDAGSTAVYGQFGGAGVLVMTSKRGGGGTMTQYTPWIIALSPRGYSLTKAFYSPKYTAKETPDNTDLRTTVYWNPNLISDVTGNCKFDFFTPDKPGKYRVVLEGMNLSGKIARQTLTFQVK